jgi:hypothetical protein
MNTAEVKGNWKEQKGNTGQYFDNAAAQASPIYC